MLRFQVYDESVSPPQYRDLAIAPDHVMAVIEADTSGGKVARVYLTGGISFEVSDASRTAVNRLAGVKAVGLPTPSLN